MMCLVPVSFTASELFVPRHSWSEDIACCFVEFNFSCVNMKKIKKKALPVQINLILHKILLQETWQEKKIMKLKVFQKQFYVSCEKKMKKYLFNKSKKMCKKD